MSKKAKATKNLNVPKGYKAISSLPKSWPTEDTPIGDVVQGVILSYDEFEAGTGKNRRTQRTAKIETDEGIVQIYESAGLKALFEYEEGTHCYIVYQGRGTAKKGRNPAKLFDVFVK